MVSKADNSRESIIHPKQRGGGQAEGVNSADGVIFGGFIADNVRVEPNLFRRNRPCEKCGAERRRRSGHEAFTAILVVACGERTAG